MNDVEPATTAEIEAASELSMRKARLVLDAFRAGGLPPPFGMPQEQAEEMWSGPLSEFSVDLLTSAAGEWVMTNTEFPTIKEFLTLVRYHAKEASDDERLRRPGTCDCGVRSCPCSECHGVHHVKVIDSMEKTETHASKKKHRKGDGSDDGLDLDGREMSTWEIHHYRPCSQCTPDRYELYAAGHFSAQHRDDGGCPECRDYMPGARRRRSA